MFFSFTDELWTWVAMNMMLVARSRGSVGSYWIVSLLLLLLFWLAIVN